MSDYAEVPVDSLVKLVVANPPRGFNVSYKRNIIEVENTRHGVVRTYRRKRFVEALIAWSERKHLRWRVFAVAVRERNWIEALSVVDVRALHIVLNEMLEGDLS